MTITVKATVPAEVLEKYNDILRNEGEYNTYGLDPQDGAGGCERDAIADTASESDSDTLIVNAAYLINELAWVMGKRLPVMAKERLASGEITKRRYLTDKCRWGRQYDRFFRMASDAEEVEPWAVTEIEVSGEPWADADGEALTPKEEE